MPDNSSGSSSPNTDEKIERDTAAAAAFAKGKEEAEFKLIIKEAQKDACRFLLIVLQSIINELVIANRLDKSTGSYIYDAVRQQAITKGWID
ncbi:MAG TPA: hypothetical protein VE548_07800 [Nitrososphaeraceae archaeon]|jgi:hypothetical protein|nr:hypothetical protein [Nitrososphaeraceae archaeon]